MAQPSEYALFVGGATVAATSSERIERRNPRSGDLVATYAAASTEDVERAVRAAHDAFTDASWLDLPPSDRSALLLRATDALQQSEEQLAAILTDEVGKSREHALAEVREGINLWRYAAASLRSLHGEFHPLLAPRTQAYTCFEPVGVVALILPWNFPFLVSAERLPFILAAGCTVVVKPSEHAGGTAFLVGEILKRAGFPDGVYNVVSGLGSGAGMALISAKDVAMISFTGSTDNGRKVMEIASRTLKRVSLELGGKSPVIVFADAQLDAALEGVVSGFTYNAGQCCIATTRLLVERTVAERFKKMLVERVATNDYSQPVATEAQKRRIDDYVETERSLTPTQSNGPLHIAPMIFDDVQAASPLARDEIFGPVLSIHTFDSEDEAIAMANDTIYGLAACVWSGDTARAMRVARRLRAGRLWINSAQENFPELPVGGYGASGIGREAGSSGIRAYCEIKSVIMKT